MLAVADFFAENLRHQPERADCNTGGCRVLLTSGGRGDCGDPGRHPGRNGHGCVHERAPVRLLGGAGEMVGETLRVLTEFGDRRALGGCDSQDRVHVYLVGPYQHEFALVNERNEYVGRAKLPAHARAESTPLTRRPAR